jgi:DNA-binding LacI/PurR family transcriptional regulator
MAVDACCAAQQYNVMFLSLRYEATTPWRDLQVPEILRRRELIAGCILAGANSPNLLEFLAHQGMPFATFGNNVGGEWRHDKYDVVWLDDIPGAYQMTRFLRSLGHQDIWFVGNLRLPWFRRRFEGYRKAMQDTGLEPHLGNIDSDNYPEIGYLATRSILGRGERVSAIFAGSDEATRGVYKALADCGRSVPRDLSVAGFNDLEADVMHPPLTTVRTFPDQIGRQLAQMLLSRIVRPDMPLQQGTVPTEIVKRESHQLLSLPVELEDETLKAGAGKGSK